MSKLRLPVFFLCCLSALGARAERKPVAFGMLGGITATTLWGEDIPAPDAHIWLTTGLTLALQLPAFLGLESDLLYVGKSASYKRTADDGSVKVNKITAHTLEIPLMLKVTIPTESEVQPVVYGGWSFAYWVSKDFTSETITTADGFIDPQPLPPEILKEDLPAWEQSLVIGGGAEWGLGTFQLRFSLGQKSLDGSEKLGIKTLVTALMAGFVF